MQEYAKILTKIFCPNFFVKNRKFDKQNSNFRNLKKILKIEIYVRNRKSSEKWIILSNFVQID